MLISGLLIETEKEHKKNALLEIKKIKGLEVTDEYPENKIGLVLESENTEQAVGICKQINSLSGVKNLNLVYYHYV